MLRAAEGIVYETPTAKQNLSIRFNDLPNDPVYIGTVSR